MITYLFFKYFLLNLKYSKLLNKVYEEENLLDNLSKLFNIRFKKDWIGRIYAVFNPEIYNGEYNTNIQIYEYNERGLSNKAYIESYIMNQLNIAKNFIKANNLFDLLTYKIEKIDEYDNYLFIIEPITFSDFVKNTKRFSILLLSLIVAGITLFLTFKYI
jgi:hypothetical protein